MKGSALASRPRTIVCPLCEVGPLGWLARRAEKVMELLGQAFELMAEDDPIQPAIKYLYVTLHEAEIRSAILEDWYRRTYVLEVEWW